VHLIDIVWSVVQRMHDVGVVRSYMHRLLYLNICCKNNQIYQVRCCLISFDITHVKSLFDFFYFFEQVMFASDVLCLQDVDKFQQPKVFTHAPNTKNN
jgi:hypothetical protein